MGSPPAFSEGVNSSAKKLHTLKTGFILGGVLLLSSTVFGQHKIARHLQHVDPDSTVDVIVQYKNDATDDRIERVVRRGGRLKARLSAIRGAAFRTPASMLSDLENDPDVAYVSPDYEVRATLDESNETVGATIAQQYGLDGSGIGIAVIDSGVAAHRDLNDSSTGLSRVVYSQNFLTDRTTSDLYGHGTHVAGILGGNGASSTGYGYSETIKGIAPKVSIISLRVLDKDGVGSDSAVIAAIGRAIQLKSKYNIRRDQPITRPAGLPEL